MHSLSHFRVLTIDIVGQPGKSAANPPSVFNDDYTNWLEDIIQSLELEKPHIVGVSTGGRQLWIWRSGNQK